MKNLYGERSVLRFGCDKNDWEVINMKKVERGISNQPEVTFPNEKKSYMPPVLTVYGRVSELTAGGSGAVEEGKGEIHPDKQVKP